MSESLVSFCHFMCVFFLLYSCARIVVSVHQFTCKTFLHCTFAALTSIADHPADAQSQTAVCSYFNRYLVVSAAYTTSTNFEDWHYIIESLFENFDWFFIKFALADVECTVNFLPSSITLLMKRVTILFPYTGSGRTSRFGTAPFLGIVNFLL